MNFIRWLWEKWDNWCAGRAWEREARRLHERETRPREPGSGPYLPVIVMCLDCRCRYSYTGVEACPICGSNAHAGRIGEPNPNYDPGTED